LAPEALPPRVRTLAEALGGRVAARSTLTEGTAVTVEIPIVAPG
jgi:signal transduction histidine kinase